MVTAPLDITDKASADHPLSLDKGAGNLLSRLIISEYGRWSLFLPVCFGLGVALYFVHPPPVPLAVWLAAFIFAGLALFIYQKSGKAGHTRPALFMGLFTGLALLFFGIGYTDYRATQSHQMLIQPVNVNGLTGRIVQMDRLSQNRVRYWLDRIETKQDLPLYSPKPTDQDGPARYHHLKIRIHAGFDDRFEIGARIGLKARLMPPAKPSWPGGYDFLRAAWFQGLGATGYALSKPYLATESSNISPAPDEFTLRLKRGLNHIRFAISEHLRAAIGGQAGAVAAALTVGDRSGLSKQSLDDMRQSGLAHLLAISGLHIGLIAALLFGLARSLMAGAKTPALKWHSKKIAALITIPLVGAYMLLAGASPPTQRAFLMAGLVLAAISLDRRALTMRPLAFAAMIVLLIAPDVLVSASFQLSFAAVLGLVAVAELYRRGFHMPLPILKDLPAPVTRPLRYFGLLTQTTLIASLTTAPFILWHFGQAPQTGLVANFLAIPLMAFVIMPLLCLALILMPFGLDWLVTGLIEGAINWMLGIASWAADLPFAFFTFAPPQQSYFMLFIISGLCAALWQSRFRVGALAISLVFLTISLSIKPQGPDIIISPTGGQLALIDEKGLWVLHQGREKFIQNQWQQQMNKKVLGDLQSLESRQGDKITCQLTPDGKLGECMIRSRPNLAPVSLVIDKAFLPEACQRQGFVISRLRYYPKDCGYDKRFSFHPIYDHGWVWLGLSQKGANIHTWQRQTTPHPWLAPWYKQKGYKQKGDKPKDERQIRDRQIDERQIRAPYNNPFQAAHISKP